MKADGVTESDEGSVERSTSELIDSMGALRPWETVTARSALVLARAMDAETDGAKLATLSRELRQAVGTLARVGEARTPVLREEPPEADPIARIVDEVALRRQGRPA